MAGYPGIYHDGASAARRDVTVLIDPDGLRIVPANDEPYWVWLLDDVTLAAPSRKGEPLRLASLEEPDRRLIVSDPEFAEALRKRVPGAFRPQHRVRDWSIGLAAAAVVVALLLGLWFQGSAIASGLARMIPDSWVEPIGEQAMRQFTGNLRVCDSAEGEAALQRIVLRLKEGLQGSPPLRVTVVDHPISNAFALPGGQIIVMKGLLSTAISADEVAGVLAHEFGHAVERHPMQSLIRYAGISTLVGLITGNSSGLLDIAAEAGGLLVMFSYHREFEREADVFAYDLLLRTDLSPRALAAFLERMRDEEGEAEGIVSYFSTHPPTDERIAGTRAEPSNPRPALDQQSWEALRSICG